MVRDGGGEGGSPGSEMGLALDLREAAASEPVKLMTLVTACNLTGSHAYLTLALHWVEPREHVVPVVVSHNARMWQLLVRGEAGAWVQKPEGAGGKAGTHHAGSHRQHTPVLAYMSVVEPAYLRAPRHTQSRAHTFTYLCICVCVTKTQVSQLTRQSL